MALNGTTLGIALSGGGFRATLFGLGSLWRLNDAGLLGKLDRITSVSGGSIIAGVLANRWRNLQFVDGRASNFADVIAKTVQDFCCHTADIEAGILGWITPFRSAGDYLTKHYASELFGHATLGSLPDPKDPLNPLFVFYATNMQTGRSFRFRQDFMADYELGITSSATVPLAIAVAASSAFPPIFSPIVLDTQAAIWRDEKWTGDTGLLSDLRRRIVLADGGIYDNMGLETLVGNVDVILVSDAGAPFEIEESPRGDYFSQLGRVRDILIDQTRALRKRWLIEDFIAKRKRGAYWGIGTHINAYAAPAALAVDSATTAALEAIPTRLASVPLDEQGRLINWGYAMADAALRVRAELTINVATALPYPAYPLT